LRNLNADPTPCHEVIVMPVRLAQGLANLRLRTLRGTSTSLALGLGLLHLSAAPPAAAADIRVRVDFDGGDLKFEETRAGTRVSMSGLLEAAEAGVAALPMSLQTFYVPDGYEVAEVRATPAAEVVVRSGVRLARQEALLEPDQGQVTRSFPRGALDPESTRHPARSSVALGGGFFAGNRIESVALFPVRWQDGNLVFTSSFDLEIDLRPARAARALTRLRSTENADVAYRQALSAIVANPEAVPCPFP
jgi:hypothetical protein